MRATQTEAFVREALSGNDASHDFAHIDRVRNMALYLAREEVRIMPCWRPRGHGARVVGKWAGRWSSAAS